jgi:hypothetical protein
MTQGLGHQDGKNAVAEGLICQFTEIPQRSLPGSHNDNSTTTQT